MDFNVKLWGHKIEKKWVISSTKLSNPLLSYQDVLDQSSISKDSLLKGISRIEKGEKIFIVKPLSRKISYEKYNRYFPNSSGELFEDDFQLTKLLFNLDGTRLYLDKSLMYNSEYYAIDWDEGLLHHITLEGILSEVNFIAWVDITEKR